MAGKAGFAWTTGVHQCTMADCQYPSIMRITDIAAMLLLATRESRTNAGKYPVPVSAWYNHAILACL